MPYPVDCGFMEEVNMPRLWTRWAGFAALILILSCGTTLAGDAGFSGSVGLEVSYTPVPPASYNIGAILSLGFDISGFSMTSATGFDLAGFQSEEITMGLDLGAVRIAEEIRFVPTFAWNELSVDMSIVGVELGIDWILANIGTIAVPVYSMGAVLELSSGIVCGFSIHSLTGFGAIDLVNILGGVEAPYSYELLYLFHHLDTLCTPPIDLDVTIVDGFYFEEELVRLEVDCFGLLSSATVWFDYMGLSQTVLEFGYRFGDPSLSFLTALRFNDLFTLTQLDFIVDLDLDVLHFTSHTAFAELVPPLPIPIVFDGQAFAMGFEVCGVQITTEIGFDGVFMFSEAQIAIEADIDPVVFKTLSVFDAGGFASQCVYADVRFCGVMLYTRAQFDFTGIQEVVFGFEFAF